MPSGSATTDEARHSRVQWSTLLLQQLVRIRLCNKYNWCPHLAEPSLPNDWHHLEKSVLVAFGQHAVLEGAWSPSPILTAIRRGSALAVARKLAPPMPRRPESSSVAMTDSTSQRCCRFMPTMFMLLLMKSKVRRVFPSMPRRSPSRHVRRR